MNQQPISTDIQSTTLKRGSLYGVRLIQLHGARWRLMARMEDEQQRSGLVTAGLDADLAANRAETRTFLAYLSGHA
jgi:hypothetical protein